MASQLRVYKVKDGRMEEFVALWRDHLVPAREHHGFTIEGAWHDDSTFAWVVHHDDFERAEAVYYDSPERAAAPVEPKTLLDEVDVRLLQRI